MNYETLMNKKETCEKLARLTSDEKLRQFYVNAAEGFESKAKKILIEEEIKNGKN